MLKVGKSTEIGNELVFARNWKLGNKYSCWQGPEAVMGPHGEAQCMYMRPS